VDGLRILPLGEVQIPVLKPVVQSDEKSPLLKAAKGTAACEASCAPRRWPSYPAKKMSSHAE